MALQSTISGLASSICRVANDDVGFSCFITPSVDIGNDGTDVEIVFQDFLIGGSIGPNGTFASISGTVNNDNEYPLLLEWYVSSSVTGTITQNNRWEFTSATGTQTDIDLSSYCVDDPLYHIEDARQYNNIDAHEFTSGKQSRKYIGKLAAGDSATLEEILTLNLIDHVADDLNTLSSGDIQLIVKWTPCR